MDGNYTLLILSQHYPISHQFQVITYEDMSIDADVVDFLQVAEQHVDQHVLDNVYTRAATAVQ